MEDKNTGTEENKMTLVKVLEILTKWQNPNHIRLMAGEMTAQEMRTVLAVLSGIKYEIGRIK
jgi:hypothetical protein